MTPTGTDTSPLTDERPPKPRPAPIPDHDSAPYWTALHEGKLLVQKCQDCGEFQLYPRDRCLACRGPVAFVEASGRGTIYSFTVIRQNYARPFRDWIPYVVALVELEEGPRLMTNLIDCDPEVLQVGDAVEARFEAVSEEAGIALFTPVG
jgi:uncharacterized OB-fold protein